VAAHDSGRIINPMFAEGQIQGALHHGLGYALTEELILDEATGVARNPGFLDYKVFKAVDMPKVEVILVETMEPTGPFGAKGIGEPGVICAAPAVANAIYNATGIRFRELPITAEKVFHALRKNAEIPKKHIT
jgi:xanthine dehydrogenase molybdenum-binding subunit